MSNGKGLQIIQQLLMEAHVKESHEQKPIQEPPLPAEAVDGANLRYIRTPEHDARFQAGETYFDTETGRVRWMPLGVDPNCR